MFHRQLGELLYRHCGVTRSAESLVVGIEAIRALRAEFWRDLAVVGGAAEFNQELERAGRVADYLELAELMCIDALDRDESCGAHFRTEHQSADGEAVRNDEDYAFVSAWEYADRPIRHREPLRFEHVGVQTRSYA